MEKIIGLIDAPFTPFHENGDLNLEPIEKYAAMLQNNGLQGVFINGSSGEGYMLTTEERMQLAERWLKAVSYTHLTLPTKLEWCRSRWSPYH